MKTSLWHIVSVKYDLTEYRSLLIENFPKQPAYTVTQMLFMRQLKDRTITRGLFSSLRSFR